MALTEALNLDTDRLGGLQRISRDSSGACTDPGLPYESHRLQAPDRKGFTSEV